MEKVANEACVVRAGSQSLEGTHGSSLAIGKAQY